MSLPLTYFGATDKGAVRSNNEDVFFAGTIWGDRYLFLLVVDGCGGYEGGEVASSMAREEIVSFLQNHPGASTRMTLLEEAVCRANNRIARERKSNKALSKMGCVLTAAIIDKDNDLLFLSHIGDTRCYLYADGQLKKLTRDHSLVGELEDAGELTEKEAMDHPQRSVIDRMLGEKRHRKGDGFVDSTILPLPKEYVLLLCSDGLTDMVSSSEISSILGADYTEEEKVQCLIAYANRKGGRDNITVAMAQSKDEDNKTRSYMKTKSNFGKGAAWMLVVTVILAFGFCRLYKNQKPYLDDVTRLQRAGQSVNLDGRTEASQLSSVFIGEGILSDQKDAEAIANHIVNQLATGETFKAIGSLNVQDYAMPAVYADTAGGAGLKARVAASSNKLGINEEYRAWLSTDSQETFFSEKDSAACHLIALVKDSESSKPLSGVPVRLKRHYYEEVNGTTTPADTTVAYLRTNQKGQAEFVVKNGYYSIIPILEGYEYGASSGSVSGMLKEGRHQFTFQQRSHTIPVFTPAEFREIKQGPFLTVRTPESYISELTLYASLFLAAWWLIFLLSGIIGKRKRTAGDMVLYPLIMLINGLGMLALLGAGNPVLDKPLGFEMIRASLLGLALMALVTEVSVARFYASGYTLSGKRLAFDPFYKRCKGISYLVAALVLMVLLAFFGTAPSGSSAKINLFFLQPSELCKFLTIIFMAAFFAENAGALRSFSDTANKVSIPIHARTVAILAAGIILVSLLYMGVLSDMGPALVLLVSFIFMYSLARGDFGQLIVGVVSFLAVTMLAKWVSLSYFVGAGIWFALWIGGFLVFRKRIYESAIFMNLLIVLFVSGGPILGALGFEHQAERLESRMAMSGGGVWDNTLTSGGDQIAQAIWGYSTGGFSGQGVGIGNESLMPAYHTDLIMATVGEQMGWRTIALVIVLMGILLYRSIRAGRKSGHPFSFYLAFGIGIVTVVQFLIVGLGSTGIIPLTGIAVPFMSYAKTSIVLNLVAFGIVVAISREAAGKYQEEAVKKYRRPLVASCFSYAALGCLFAIVLSGYMMVWRDETLVRPGLFANNAGIRSYLYNPRIQVLIDKIRKEDIYDRNGALLATSNREEVLDSTVVTRAKRYYPFGMQTFFFTGDYNDKTQWSASVSNPYGFNAENRYLARLRGFDNLKRQADGRAIIRDIPVPSYKPSRFLPAYERKEDYRVAEYDYSELTGMLKEGLSGHREIKSITREAAVPVRLTIDATLQTRLQNRLAEYVAETASLCEKEKLRISVVVLKTTTGDLLCSSNYPLPRKEILDSLEQNDVFIYDERDPHRKAYTDRDLGLTFQTHPGSTAKMMTALAAFTKVGEEAAGLTYDIDLEEIIENGRVKEPFSSIGGRRFTRNVSMKDAIVQSSNCYFVNLMNDKDLYANLGIVYGTVGARLDGHEGRANTTPYYFYDAEFTQPDSFAEEVNYLSKEGLRLYNDYENNYRSKGDRRKLSRFHGSADYWGIAYGQGHLYASPLNMARVASIIANDGTFVSTRYEMGEAIRKTQVVPQGTASLKAAMQEEADKHRGYGIPLPGKGDQDRMFSKTGTPERTWVYIDEDGAVVEEKPNDGWYVCTIVSEKEQSPLTIAVRMERLGSLGSGAAVRLTAETVLPVLQECGYGIY